MSGSVYYNTQQFADLRYRYSCLFDAYTILYPNDAINISDIEFAKFQQDNKDALGIFDLELTKFMLILDLEHLLFQPDSLSVLPEIIQGKQDAIQVEKNPDGGYDVEQNNRYHNLNLTTQMSSIMETRAETALHLQLEMNRLNEERERQQQQDNLKQGFIVEEVIDSTETKAQGTSNIENNESVESEQSPKKSKFNMKSVMKQLNIFSVFVNNNINNTDPKNELRQPNIANCDHPNSILKVSKNAK